MISWTKLLTARSQEHDNLRYSSNTNHVPKIVVWNTTSNCNLKCRHCYLEATSGQSSGELSKAQAENFIEDLANMGVTVLLFTGGEPLLRKDIFHLGQFAKEKGLRPVLSTNGTLITKEVAKELKQAGFVYVGISLDGTQATNDLFRQSKGAFSSALAGIRYCRDAGIKVGLRFTLTKFNFRDLPQIFDLIERESIKRFCLYHLVYAGRGSSLKRSDVSNSDRKEILELIWQKTLDFSKKGVNTEILTVDNHADGVWIYLKLKKENPLRAQEVFKLLKVQGGNSTGSKIGAVDNLGDVYPDQFWRNHCLGNIKDKKFSAIWLDGKSSFLNDLRNRKTLLKGRCRGCNFLSICNGNFRARAEGFFNDPWAHDPGCYLTDKEICGKYKAPSSSGCAGANT